MPCDFICLKASAGSDVVGVGTQPAPVGQPGKGLHMCGGMQGYDLGPGVPEDLTGAGEAIIGALQAQEQSGVVARGADAAAGVPCAAGGPVATEVTPRELREALTFDDRWGPTEWGPIPFLPKSDILVENMEKSWGDLLSYRGLSTTGTGNLLVSGVQVCTVSVQWICVETKLGRLKYVQTFWGLGFFLS